MLIIAGIFLWNWLAPPAKVVGAAHLRAVQSTVGGAADRRLSTDRSAFRLFQDAMCFSLAQ
jgi:hypothetical protein